MICCITICNVRKVLFSVSAMVLAGARLTSSISSSVVCGLVCDCRLDANEIA
ncbi:hypothetical protein PF005_g981 [Phytophthora fragariae]|uniref:RxLR effector protein n=1 Tax=Phytophthora fragariae TaxID=53985 RepID=A0A6A3LQB4_9STRA|nr:hypothetical protein PF003_g1465 [Phytophthora fragariae]KAE9021419.1 hypothetical protein PF011_g4953 [Phytophthora fragariae]KAE9125883.1 hypothetical protein PF010_g5460 [Phytophthora fragariae]KAE9129492.1 hypothetical protein PF007_g4866 [Phytophthora fragariae]KAE9143156.1 hypothetical protein PF006_g11791 [Phytophthora fragariae]